MLQRSASEALCHVQPFQGRRHYNARDRGCEVAKLGGVVSVELRCADVCRARSDVAGAPFVEHLLAGLLDHIIVVAFSWLL